MGAKVPEPRSHPGRRVSAAATDRRPRVAIVQRYIASYRAPFYDRLRSELALRGIDLTLAVSSDPRHPSARGDEVAIPGAIEIPGREFGVLGYRALWQPLTPEIRAADLVVVEQASRLLLNYLLLARQRLRRRPVAFWGHGRSFDDRDSGSLEERLKRWTSRHVHWWFAYNDLAADVVRELGFPPQRITVVENSTDTRALRAAVEAVDPATIAETRRSFGLGPGPVGIFVGNFSHPKQLDFLFEAAEHLHRLDPGFSLLMVGQGERQPVVEEMAARRPYVSYVGNRFGDDLARCFAVADALMVPGWAGLVLVDGFAGGAPPMASASFPHPPEISYVDPGGNGLLIEDGGSPARYAERVHRFLGDADERARLTDGCARAAEHYSIEAMARRFADGLSTALARAR